jgi:nucleoside-diphosphate kinase
MEKSLVLVKPDAMKRGLAGTIIARLQEEGLILQALKMLRMDRALAERHYAIHKDKPFFKDLVKSIISTPVVAAVFAGDDAVARIREVMGATDPSRAEKGTVRADFGLNIQENSTHASDSPENAVKEIELFFSKDEIFEFY